MFLDCDCFQQYIRSELTFVDYVRDRESADVHVLGQSRETGGSAREYALRFVGAGRLAGFDFDLRAVTAASDTEEHAPPRGAVNTDRRLPHVHLTRGVPNRLQIEIEEAEAAPAAGASDRWNFWVYSVRASAELKAEESSRLDLQQHRQSQVRLVAILMRCVLLRR